MKRKKTLIIIIILLLFNNCNKPIPQSKSNNKPIPQSKKLIISKLPEVTFSKQAEEIILTNKKERLKVAQLFKNIFDNKIEINKNNKIVIKIVIKKIEYQIKEKEIYVFEHNLKLKIKIIINKKERDFEYTLKREQNQNQYKEQLILELIKKSINNTIKMIKERK